jgi:ferritin-like metal-binding protein YciE
MNKEKYIYYTGFAIVTLYIGTLLLTPSSESVASKKTMQAIEKNQVSTEVELKLQAGENSTQTNNLEKALKYLFDNRQGKSVQEMSKLEFTSEKMERIEQTFDMNNSNVNANEIDAIGGYLDENALAPEDGMPQNNNIASIGFYDPSAQAPESLQILSEVDDSPISLETENTKAPEDNK